MTSSPPRLRSTIPDDKRPLLICPEPLYRTTTGSNSSNNLSGQTAIVATAISIRCSPFSAFSIMLPDKAKKTSKAKLKKQPNSKITTLHLKQFPIDGRVPPPPIDKTTLEEKKIGEFNSDTKRRFGTTIYPNLPHIPIQAENSKRRRIDSSEKKSVRNF